jgi:hypothetical protein
MVGVFKMAVVKVVVVVVLEAVLTGFVGAKPGCFKAF